MAADPTVNDGATFEDRVVLAAKVLAKHFGGPPMSWLSHARYIRRILTAAGVPEILVTSQADRTLIEEKTEQVERLKAHVTELERLARQNRKHVSQRLKRYDQNFRALIEAKDAEKRELFEAARDYHDRSTCPDCEATDFACDLGELLDRLEGRVPHAVLSEPAVEASPESVTTKHMSHWQSGCNCLGDSAICCVESCECHVVPDSPAEGDEELPPLNWAGYPPPLPDVPSPEEPSR